MYSSYSVSRFSWWWHWSLGFWWFWMTVVEKSWKLLQKFGCITSCPFYALSRLVAESFCQLHWNMKENKGEEDCLHSSFVLCGILLLQEYKSKNRRRDWLRILDKQSIDSIWNYFDKRKKGLRLSVSSSSPSSLLSSGRIRPHQAIFAIFAWNFKDEERFTVAYLSLWSAKEKQTNKQKQRNGLVASSSLFPPGHVRHQGLCVWPA